MMIHLITFGVALALAYSYFLTTWHRYKVAKMRALATEELMRAQSKYHLSMAWNLDISLHKIKAFLLATIVPGFAILLSGYVPLDACAVLLSFGMGSYIAIPVLYFANGVIVKDEVHVFYDRIEKVWKVVV